MLRGPPRVDLVPFEGFMLEIHGRVLQSVAPVTRREVEAEAVAYRHRQAPDPPAKLPPPHLRGSADPAPVNQAAREGSPPTKSLPEPTAEPAVAGPS
eukprot:6721932-Alexandrium_andersonii.AAC.1